MSIEQQINAEILKFSKELHPWQVDALKRLLQKSELTATDKKEIVDRACLDHNVKTSDTALPVLKLKDEEVPVTVIGPRSYMVGLGDLENVNALKTGSRLALGKGLTVVFGQNASGKSGYARVMKKACTARAIDPVLPNVYADKPAKGPAKAVFQIEEDGTEKKEEWEDGSNPPTSLRRFAVFDAKCGRTYISESNTITFLPWMFDVLAKLAYLTKEVKDQFASQAHTTEPKPNALAPLIDNTTTGKLLASISAETKVEVVQMAAKWDSLDEGSLKTKEQELFKLKANSPTAIRQSLTAERKRIETLQARLGALEGALSDGKVLDVKEKVSQHKKYDQAVKAAAALAFGGADLKGIGSDAWRELILAAAKYSTEVAYPGETFPSTVNGALCVLCLQTLSDSAKARLKRFWEFLHDETSRKRDGAKTEMDLTVNAIGNLRRAIPEQIRSLEDLLASSQPDLWNLGKGFYTSAGKRISEIENATASGDWGSVMPLAPSVIPECAAKIQAIDAEISKVHDDTQASKEIQNLSAEVEDLKSRKRLAQHLSSVLAHLTSLKASRRLSDAAASISTLSISNKTKDLQKQYVTDAFKKSFLSEVKSFGVRRVKAGIAEHSAKGKVLHDITLDGASTPANPLDVLSEGEKTAISLAYFLADLGTVEETCGIILDDPLTSLDHGIREKVIGRLISEAKKRQVVIFTHDLSVYSEIESAAKVDQVQFTGQQVEALGPHVGIVSNDEPWDVLDVGKRVQKLDELLKEAVIAENQGDTKKYRDIVAGFYGRLRSTWERSVEELVFNKVIGRYGREVKTQALTGVAVDAETVTCIFQGMAKTSAAITAHDHAAAENKPLASSDDLRADLKLFKEFLEKQRSKRKAVSEKLLHLK